MRVLGLVSKQDGGRGVLRDGALGLLVDPASRGEIQGAIREALKAPRGRVPQGLEHFSFEKFTRRLHAVIDKLLGFPVTTVAPASGSDIPRP